MQKITLIGRLGRDAAIRETQEGTKIVSFTMAVNSRFRGVDKTSWYDVSTFNYDRYRNMIKYLTKGSQVVVLGDLDADIEEGRDGKVRCRRYVTADSIEFNSNGTSGNTASDRTEETTTRRSKREPDPEDVSDEDLEVTTKPKKRAEEYEEDEEPPKKSKKRPEPVEEDEEEPKVEKKKAKKVEPEEDEEEEAPAKKPKKRPVPVEEDEDDESELPF